MKRLLAALSLLTYIEFAMPADTAVVPPGHKVTVISPTANGHVNVVSSGALIVDYGRNGNWRLTNAQIEAAHSRRSASAVVILQDEMIVALKQSNELGDFFAYWTAARAKGISAVWVLPLRASVQTSIISSIHSAGYGVHASAPDGACFVEVHKPDGSVVVGMPGASLQPK